MQDKKERKNFSFSLKKTDSPKIKEFLEAQDNYSESIRYLILKYCTEYGVENISNKLNEFLFINASSFNAQKNNSINISEEYRNDNFNSDLANNTSEVKEISDLEKEESKNHKENKKEDDEIPECYRK